MESSGGLDLAAQSAGPWPVLLIGGFILLGVFLLFFSLSRLRRRRLIQNIPTCKAAGVFIGLVELEGTAEAEAPLRSPLAGVSCVLYSWSASEHWSRTVTETTTDSDGKTHTRTRHESGWKQVASGASMIPFYLQDETGLVRVDPEGAEIEDERVFEQTCGPSDPLYYGMGPVEAVWHSDHRRRFTETAIPLHRHLYVIGNSKVRDDVVAPEIARDRQAPLFLVSVRSQRRITRGLGWQSGVLAVLGILVVTLGATLLRPAGPGAFLDHLLANWPLAVAALGTWALGWVWVVYNGLVRLANRTDQAWSNVDVELKRRADLIGNLVAAVKGLRDHERSVHESLARLRSQAEVTRPGEAGPDPQGCGRALAAIVERYPELRADRAFATLHEQLVEIEQRIALARDYYNAITSHLNARTQELPDRWVAALAGLRRRPLLHATEFERAPVTVRLAEA